MHSGDRDHPAGKIWIWYNDEWTDPGLGGHATPIFLASVDVFQREGQTFWGLVVHWNTYLKKHVMILNRIQDPKWTTEGIYIALNDRMSNPGDKDGPSQ